MIQIRGLSFSYPASTFTLDIESLEVLLGQRVAVIGPSGSGKTTLLNLIAGVDIPHAGTVEIGGICVSGMPDAARRAYRLGQIGMVFQNFELLDYLSVLDNILLPLRISLSHRVTPELLERARTLAEFVGIGDKLSRYPGQLSQGERQRVAVSRALLLQPPLLLADEPTGNLDPVNRTLVLDLLLDYARERNATLITVTHDENILQRFDRVINFAELNRARAA
jgi:putative ABC transport system ATP-binding protein